MKIHLMSRASMACGIIPGSLTYFGNGSPRKKERDNETKQILNR